jgi:hypothetical protein
MKRTEKEKLNVNKSQNYNSINEIDTVESKSE